MDFMGSQGISPEYIDMACMTIFNDVIATKLSHRRLLRIVIYNYIRKG